MGIRPTYNYGCTTLYQCENMYQNCMICWFIAWAGCKFVIHCIFSQTKFSYLLVYIPWNIPLMIGINPLVLWVTYVSYVGANTDTSILWSMFVKRLRELLFKLLWTQGLNPTVWVSQVINWSSFTPYYNPKHIIAAIDVGVIRPNELSFEGNTF